MQVYQSYLHKECSELNEKVFYLLLPIRLGYSVQLRPVTWKRYAEHSDDFAEKDRYAQKNVSGACF